METLVSVIVPVYNTEKYLEYCINSILKQTHRNIEIILVDDGSTDKSLSICNQYKKIDERINVISKQNTGVSDSRNIGVNNAKGEYILFVDSDDLLVPHTLPSLIISAMDSRTDILIADYQSLTDVEISKHLLNKWICSS